jgi:hypothetical protein
MYTCGTVNATWKKRHTCWRRRNAAIVPWLSLSRDSPMTANSYWRMRMVMWRGKGSSDPNWYCSPHPLRSEKRDPSGRRSTIRCCVVDKRLRYKIINIPAPSITTLVSTSAALQLVAGRSVPTLAQSDQMWPQKVQRFRWESGPSVTSRLWTKLRHQFRRG